MAIPISGDKPLAQRDLNPTRNEASGQPANRAADEAQSNPRPLAQNDSLQLNFQAQTSRPLSESVQTPSDARNKLADLLGNMRANPGEAMAAQGSMNPAQADALLNRAA